MAVACIEHCEERGDMTIGYARPARIHGRMECLEQQILELVVGGGLDDPLALSGYAAQRVAWLGKELADLRRVHEVLMAEAERLGVRLEDLDCQPNSVGWMDLPRGTVRCERCGCPCASPL
jgi:hypothetical protein